MSHLILTLLLAWSNPRGHLILIGGGEKPPEIMNRFIALAGGKDAEIVVLPTASEARDTSKYYRKLFEAAGCTRVTVLRLKKESDADRSEHLAALDRAGGVFFSGGDQRRITAALLGTRFLTLLRQRFYEGIVVGGTSAGTACMSPMMLTGDGRFDRITAENVVLKTGLGLAQGMILDQHFVARQRQNRLMSAVLEHPHLLGVGVDEATAVWIKPDATIEVLGQSQVIIYDARLASISRRDDGLLQASGMTFHLLGKGDVFDLESGKPHHREHVQELNP